MSDQHPVEILNNKIENLNAQLDEVTHHKSVLHSAFMEHLQAVLNHRVTISKLEAELKNTQTALGVAKQTIEDQQKKIEELENKNSPATA